MKTPVLEPLFNKVVRLGVQLYLKETPVYSFYHCEYCGIFKNSFFYRTTPVAVFDDIT